eukprot:TRINITY_DN3259_c0_g1_i4.p1 TRINITY_DN3259_c0_g1~~TRINITY_DN3259_c0_g1_i4.p1  ORF type:complete len:457 (+),score=116.16 TRINITY_DN3259_c0_g1_i4:69-1439(+)
MSVTAHVDPDGVREPCFVAADGSGTVGALLAAVHGALALDRPVEEWEFFFVDGDGVEVPLCEDGAARLEDVGIVGAMEMVVARLGDMYVRRQKLRARGIDGQDAAWDRYANLLTGGHGPLAEEGGLALVKLIAGSGWLAKHCSYENVDPLPLLLTVAHAPESVVEELIQLLVESGSDVNADHDGVTPLRRAARKGNANVARALIAAGARVDAVGARSEFCAAGTALCEAAHSGHAAFVRVLLECGAEVYWQHEDGRQVHSALHYATMREHIEVMHLLLDYNAPVDAGDTHTGLPPLHFAHSAACLDALLARGASVDASDRYGHTALHASALFGAEGEVRMLLDRGAAVTAVLCRAPIRGWARPLQTPLHFAAWGDKPGVIRILFEHGAAVNAMDSAGETPLHLAASKGHVQAMRALLDHGASVDAQNEDGKTPFDVAASEEAKGVLEKAAKEQKHP